MNTSRYESGHFPTIIHHNVVMMTADVDDVLARDVWEIVTREQWAVVDVIDRLASAGLAHLPDFALVVQQGDTRTVVVRGSLQVDIETEVGIQHVSGEAVSMWREVSAAVTPNDRVIVSAKAAPSRSSGGLPIVSGVVYAARVEWGAATCGVENQQLVHLEASGQAEGELEVSTELEAPESESGELETGESEAGESGAGELGTAEPETDAPVVEDSEIEDLRTQEIDPNATLGEADSVSKFEAMFGHTIAGRRLEDAAVREPEGPAGGQSLSLPGANVGAGVSSNAHANLDAVANADAHPEVQAPAGDHAGDTVSAAALAELRAQRQTENPPTTPTTKPSNQIQVTLTLSTGKVVELGRPAIFGRSPRAHGSTSADLPQLVIIDNPYVSGSHVMVAIEDGVALATDMSTNGTLITRAGASPVRLDKGEATALTDGCVLSLTADISVAVSVSRGGLQ